MTLALVMCGHAPPASALSSARRAPEAGDARQDTVAALHREGEVMFAAADYAGARNAWLDAYKRIQRTPETWPYRATLLSLVVTAALAEHERNGRNERIEEVVDLVKVARSTPALDSDVAAMLDTEWERVRPYAKRVPEPEPEPAPVPVVHEPAPLPPADSSPPAPRPSQGGGRPALWIGAGTATLLGGVAAAVVGTRFKPRATDLVRGTNDSTTQSPGADFIAAEQRKGRGWVVGGSVAATVGTAALVTGIVLLVRSRR